MLHPTELLDDSDQLMKWIITAAGKGVAFSDLGVLVWAGANEDELTPIDPDMNLVQNLLASYQAQEGLPGPASNLAGMLGLNLHWSSDMQPATFQFSIPLILYNFAHVNLDLEYC